MKHLLAITIALLPSAVIAEQFTPQQLIEVMTKSPENRDVRVHDGNYSSLDAAACPKENPGWIYLEAFPKRMPNIWACLSPEGYAGLMSQRHKEQLDIAAQGPSD